MPRAQCIVHRGDRVLMVRHKFEGVTWWCLPGGGIEEGETPSEAALRELREECHVEGTVVRQTALVWYGPGQEHYTYQVEIGAQEPRLGADPELEGDDPFLVEVRWMRLCEVPERDRCFLWAAGLLGVGAFQSEVEGWGNDTSYPDTAPASRG